MLFCISSFLFFVCFFIFHYLLYPDTGFIIPNTGNDNVVL